MREQLRALGAAPGVAHLEALLTRVESLLAAGRIALRVVDTQDLVSFQGTLLELRDLLEPVRDTLTLYPHRLRQLLAARAAPPAGIDALLNLILAYQRTLDDLLWCLPTRRPHSVQGVPSGQETSGSDVPNPAPS